MENFIKKIFSGKNDDAVHNEFVKYSRGSFEGKYLIEAKSNSNKFTIKTGPEFANHLVRTCLEKSGGNIDAEGVIVSTFDIRGGMGGFAFSENEEIKQFMGIKQLKVNGSIPARRVIEVMNKFPRAFFALSFAGNDFDLKIKAKAPKSSKPSTKGESVLKADFCSLKTTARDIINDLLFDIGDFKEISISHTIKIDSIEIPKGEKEPVKIREKAIRKGKIIRKITVDGKSITKEAGFEA